jgi:hypothetical protein
MFKTYLTLFCMACLVLSCNIKTDKEVNATKSDSTIAESGQKARSLKETATILGGSWIADDYLANLKKNKAVYTNPKYKTTLFGMSFIEDSLATGSTLLYGFSPHEVTYSWPVYFNTKSGHFEYDPKQDIGDKPLGNFSLDILDDNLLELKFTKTGKKERYRKADIEEELNSLFAGTYTDKATGKTVTFTLDGKVKGLPGYVQYYVQFDPDDEYAVPFDAILLYANPTDEAGKPYHFKINGNTLTLYNVDEHEVEKYVEYTYTIGKEAYTLTKQ